MKVNYLFAGWTHTGGGMVLFNFMDKLCERGHTVHAVTPQERIRWEPGFSRKIIGRFSRKHPVFIGAKRLLKRYLPVEDLRRLTAKPPVLELSSLNEALIRNWLESDVTISTFCTTAYANYSLADRTIPLYHMQHWEELLFTDEFHRKMSRLTYSLPLALVANSSWLRETVHKCTGRDSQLLLPGVDNQVFFPRARHQGKYTSPQKIRIVSYYSPHAIKRWPDGLEAMRKVFSATGRDRVEWLVYGGRPREIPDVPVTFVGLLFGEALAELYSSAHIVFIASSRESFPLPPIEGMASGTAVIATGTGTEDYAFDGINALVRPAKAPGQLAEAILELVENPSRADDLAQAGLQTARNLTWDKAADNLEAILKAVTDAPEAFLHTRQAIEA